MARRSWIGRLGRMADIVALRILRLNQPELAHQTLGPELRSRLFTLQTDAICRALPGFLALVVVVTLAALAVDIRFHGLRLPSLIWAGAGILVMGLGIGHCRHWRRAGNRHRRRMGGIALLAAVAAGGFVTIGPLWVMGLHLIPGAAGYLIGALAVVAVIGANMLGAVLLAGLGFAATIGIGVIAALPAGTIWLSLPLGLAFLALLTHGLVTHATTLLGEIMRRDEALAQRDDIATLLGDYEAASLIWYWRCDENLVLREISPGLIAALGLGQLAERMPLRGLLGRAGARANKPGDAQILAALARAPADLPNQIELDLRIRAGTPEERIFTFFLRKTVNAQGDMTGMQGFARDITEEYHAKENALYLATHDMMTGFLNSGAFHQELAEQLAAFNRSAAAGLAVFLFIDADNLKSVNDTHGHMAGDALIATLAARLRHEIGPDALAARKGGDEFLVAILDVAPDEVDRLAARILQSVCANFTHEGKVLDLSCSMGVSHAPAGSADMARLELEADRALYFAKDKGRGRIEHYNAALGRSLVAERRIASDLPAAIRDRHLGCVFQPIIDLATGRITACEALVRWDHPDLGPVAPEQVIAAARLIHCTGALGALMLHNALAAVRDWPEGIMVTVNAMAQELAERDFCHKVLAALRNAQVSPDRLGIEITESELLENSAHVIRNLTRLRAAGVTIAVDDFGAGYSSLNYLPQYPNDVIKIDRSLIANAAASDAGPTILNAVATLARALQLRTVAEGVETRAELDLVRAAGIQMVQGFYFHRPMRPDELQAFLATRRAPVTAPA